jgi:hypothetical protein
MHPLPNLPPATVRGLFVNGTGQILRALDNPPIADAAGRCLVWRGIVSWTSPLRRNRTPRQARQARYPATPSCAVASIVSCTPSTVRFFRRAGPSEVAEFSLRKIVTTRNR